jgi:RNA polymerase sigma-70 factor (ECF subfamily)
MQNASVDTERLYATYLATLRVHLGRRLANEHDIQDLAQEACLRLLKAGDSQAIDNPKAYLCQIANNLLYQQYKLRMRGPETGMELDNLPSQQVPVDEAVTIATRQELLEQAMQTLPRKCQTALVLRWRYGLRVQEIADHMDLSRGMVKKYLTNGLDHFKRRLRRFAIADSRA